MDPYTLHYKNQAGGVYDAAIGTLYRSSLRRQRGRGFGQIFRNIISFVSPLFKSGAVALGREALQTGKNIISDVASSASPPNIADITKQRLLESRDKLVRRMRGTGRRKRRRQPALRRKRTKRAQSGGRIKRRSRVVKRRRKMRSKMDIFSNV